MSVIADLTPDMLPLKQSATFDEVEEQLRDQFIDLFETYLRAAERDLNIYGVPHLGSIELIEKHVTRDGLALIRSDDASMKYLYRAWKARNKKRGMHFLRTYLQLLWPDGWVVEQLWQDKTQPYPMALTARSTLSNTPHATHFLTSRIRISIDSVDETGVNIPVVEPALRAVIGAKFVLTITILRRFENIGDSGLGLTGGMFGATVGSFAGEMIAGEFANDFEALNAGFAATVGSFVGESVLGSAVVP